jgi:hypothetical protein
MHPLLRRCLLFGSIAIVSLLALPGGAVYAYQSDGDTVVVQPNSQSRPLSTMQRRGARSWLSGAPTTRTC